MITTFLYKSLMEQILNNMPSIKHIDLWNNQTAMEVEEIPFNRPAVFIELVPMQWLTQGSKQQVGDREVIVRLVTDTQGSATASTESDATINSSLQRLSLLEELFVTLQGYQAHDGKSQFSKLVRIGEQLDTNSSTLNTDQYTFRTRLTDSSATPTFAKAPFKFKVSIDLVDTIG